MFSHAGHRGLLIVAMVLVGADGLAQDPLPRRAGPLGVRFEPVPAGGLRIVEVLPGSAAAAGGLEPGFTITAVDGQATPTAAALVDALRKTQAGGRVLVAVRRGEEPVKTVPLTLVPVGDERVPGSRVRYDSVTVPAGYRLRTIVTEPIETPRAAAGRSPAVLFVQGIPCQSIDRPASPDAVDTRLVHALAEAGFVTMRVDKPGLGDSEGPACSEIDFETELEGYQAALRQLVDLAEARMPRQPDATPGSDRGAGGGTWRKLPTEPYPGKQDDVFFITATTGWYGNGAGKVFRTADGGATWTKVWEKPGTFVRCLAFLDEQVGVLGNVGTGYFPGVTDEVPIYRTIDGGTTWEPVTDIDGAPVAGLCAFDVVPVPFINAGVLDRRPRIVGVGRVGGPAALVRSDDRGVTWKRGSLPAEAAMAFDVTFLDERRGFVAAATDADVSRSRALILATEDGGDTWREVYRSGRPFETTWKLSFPSDTVGYCTVQSYDPDPAASRRFVAKTTDGGRSWTEIPLVDDHAVRAFGVAFTDEATGWVGAMPHGFQTTDGGATWTKASFGNAVNKIRLVRGEGGTTAYAIGVDLHKLERAPTGP